MCICYVFNMVTGQRCKRAFVDLVMCHCDVTSVTSSTNYYHAARSPKLSNSVFVRCDLLYTTTTTSRPLQHPQFVRTNALWLKAGAQSKCFFFPFMVADFHLCTTTANTAPSSPSRPPTSPKWS